MHARCNYMVTSIHACMHMQVYMNDLILLCYTYYICIYYIFLSIIIIYIYIYTYIRPCKVNYKFLVPFLVNFFGERRMVS